MTDEKFTELVNLYFDKEISADELKQLKSEVAACPHRKQAFAERYRLDRAMRLALEPERSQRRRRGSHRSGSGSYTDAGSSRVGSAGSSPLTRWLLGSGLAASLALGLILLPPLFREANDSAAQPGWGGSRERNLPEQDPLQSVGYSELQRYAERRQGRESERYASLVAQMRLMGLRPELTPRHKELRDVNLAAAYQPKQRASQAELLRRVQRLQAIPEPKLLRFDDMDNNFESSWSGGFEVSPARFGGF